MNEVDFSKDAHLCSAAQTNSVFGTKLLPVEANSADAWVWLAYDQLNVAFLESLNVEGRLGVVLIESSAKAQRRPYHQQKLGVLLSNQRHFALELQAMGYPVTYLIGQTPYAQILSTVQSQLGNLHCITAAERELRNEVAHLVEGGQLIEHEHPGWLTPQAWFTSSVGNEPPFRMDAFYRKVRKETGWLMDEGKPRWWQVQFRR